MIKIYLFIIFFLSIIFVLYLNDRRKIWNMKNHSFSVTDSFNIPVYEEEKIIPKNIYRIYGLKDNKEDLDKYRFIFEETEKISPEIKENIIFGKEEIENFVLKYYNQKVLDTIRLINYNYSACVSDIIRLLVIYAKGGIYLDVKTQLLGDITTELNNYPDKLLVSYFSSLPFVFTGWTDLPPYGEISNWFFASPKGNPVLRECIIQSLTNISEAYKEKEKYDHGAPYILALTGPYMFTNVIKSSKNIDKVKFLSSMSLTSFILSGWNGKLRKEAYNLDNDKIQRGRHWKQLTEPLFN